MARTLPLRRWQALNFQPNQWALNHVHASEAQFNAYVTARQVGKTEELSMVIDGAMEAPNDEFGRPPYVGLLAPTYGKAELSVSKYETRLARAFGTEYYKKNSNKHSILLPHNGAQLQWLSAEDPKSVVGYTFSALGVDEGQDVPDIVWQKIVPTLSVRNAQVFAFGTPDITPDQTWFEALFARGQDEGWEDYNSHTVTAYENPWMSVEAIKQAKEELTEREFRMLYLGEWVHTEGAVFREWENALLPSVPEFHPDRQHVMSVDFAVHEDFNVVMVGETATRTVVRMERWNRSAPIETYDRIERIWEESGRPWVVTDDTGAGIPMTAELRERGIRCLPQRFGPDTKMPMVGRLAADMQHRRIQFPGWDPLTRELKAFVFVKTPSGKLTAKAAAGFHDDVVTALMLLNEGFHARGRGGAQPYSYLESSRSILRV